jgi:hypothetical protein
MPDWRARKPRDMPKRLSFKAKDVNRPPRGEPFVWHQVELLRSPPWRSRSINCVRLIEFLLVEQMAHAGLENGNLLATFDQLVAWGIGRRLVTDTVDEAEALGLIEARRGGRKGLVANHLSTYRLTFYASRCKLEGEAPYWSAPTDEWKRLKTFKDVQAAIAATRHAREKLRLGSKKNRKQVHEGEPVRVHEVELLQYKNENRKSENRAENCQIGTVHEGVPLYISTSTPDLPAEARGGLTATVSKAAARAERRINDDFYESGGQPRRLGDVVKNGDALGVTMPSNSGATARSPNEPAEGDAA